MSYPIYEFPFLNPENLVKLVRLDNPDTYPFDHLHAHEFNEIMVFENGGGTHYLDFKEQNILDRSIHIIAGGDPHWVERSTQSNGFAIVLKEQFLLQLQNFNSGPDYDALFSCSRIINLSNSEWQEFSFLFKELQNDTIQHAYAINLLAAFITKMATTFYADSSAFHKQDPLMIQLVSLINTHYKERPTAELYAAKLFMAVSTLIKRVKKSSGKTINQIQQERLLKEAKKLLFVNEKNVQEISDELGFKEMAHFSNWFKANTGTSPSDFRRE